MERYFLDVFLGLDAHETLEFVGEGLVVRDVVAGLQFGLLAVFEQDFEFDELADCHVEDIGLLLRFDLVVDLLDGQPLNLRALKQQHHHHLKP
jgi:hypothetical protein